MRTTCAAVLLAAALAFPALAGTIPARPEGWVSDFAGVLGAGNREGLAVLIAGVEKRTAVEIAVVTVKSLDGMTIEDYSIRLAGVWRVGKKGKDNGVLILVAPNERKVRIEVGYGLEGVLTDGRCGAIIRESMGPAFKRGDYAGGIRAAIERIADLIEGKVDRGAGTGGGEGDLAGLAVNPVFASRSTVEFLLGAVVAGMGFGFAMQKYRAGWLLMVAGLVAWGAGVAILHRHMEPGMMATFSLIMAILGLVLANAKKIARESRSGTGFWAGVGGSGGGWGGGGGGGFGGFGGGSFGGGGASGSW